MMYGEVEEGLQTSDDDRKVISPKDPSNRSESVGTETTFARKQLKQLSATSKKYDIDGDGILDSTEAAMRNMDKSGRGFLTNDKVHEIMLQHMNTQRELFKTRKVAAG